MILAEWTDEKGLSHALSKLRDAHIGPLETYTPAPLEEEPTSLVIPCIILIAGVLGVASSFGLQAWSSIAAYAFDIGARPQFAWASFVPTAFENAVLVAIGAGFVAYMVINRLPQLYHPVDEWAPMRRASRDRWFVRIDATDPATVGRARALLHTLGPINVAELPG